MPNSLDGINDHSPKVENGSQLLLNAIELNCQANNENSGMKVFMKHVSEQKDKCVMDLKYNLQCGSRTSRMEACLWDSFG